jgi:hypothetical protein
MLMCEQLTEVNGQLVSRINVNAMIREVTRRMHIIAELLRDPEIFPLPETASREGVDTFKQQLCDFAESVAAFNKREMPTAIMAFADRAPARGQHDRG